MVDPMTTLEMVSIVVSLLIVPVAWWMWKMEAQMKEIIKLIADMRTDAHQARKEQYEAHKQQLIDHERMMEKHIEMYSKIQTRWDMELKK